MKILLALLALVSLAVAPAAQGQVWTVAADGSGDFVVLQQAIDAAADGDAILVAPGDYGSALIEAKSLVLQAREPGVTVTAFTFFGDTPALVVQDLAAGQEVLVRGIAFRAIFTDPFEVVEVRSCAGPVLFEDCQLGNGALGTGLLVVGSGSVTLAGCEVLSGPGPGLGGVPGLRAIDSGLFLYDTLVRGAIGFPEDCPIFLPCTPPGDGGPAIWLSGTELLFSNGQALGGHGACDPTVFGGPGLLLDGSSIVRNRGSLFQGGASGLGSCTVEGNDGAPIEGEGVVEEPAGDPRSFAASSPASSGGFLTMTYEGEAGDYAFLLFRPGVAADAALWIDPLFALHLDIGQLLYLPRGFLPESGTIVDVLSVPSLAGGFVPLALQALYSTVGGPWVTSGPSTTILLGGL